MDYNFCSPGKYFKTPQHLKTPKRIEVQFIEREKNDIDGSIEFLVLREIDQELKTDRVRRFVLRHSREVNLEDEGDGELLPLTKSPCP